MLTSEIYLAVGIVARCWPGWPPPTLPGISPESPWGKSTSVTDHSQSQEGISVRTDPHSRGGFIPLSFGLEGW